MPQDILDAVLREWRTERPNLDTQALAVVGRILRLAGILERRANQALKPFDLPIWAFDVLGTLQRHGKPFSMTPTQLMQSTVLSSGAMTNRIDRLQQLGLVSREPDSHDRRSLKVRLTPQGLKLVEKAAAVRMREAQEALETFSPHDRKSLADLLRKLMLAIDGPT